MTIKELVEINCFKVLCIGNFLDNEIKKPFC